MRTGITTLLQDIVLAGATKFAEVMQADRELSKGVFGVLSGISSLRGRMQRSRTSRK